MKLKKFFRPELINRIDEQIVFQPLGEDNVREILKTMLNEISADVEKRYNIKIKLRTKQSGLFLKKVIVRNTASENCGVQLSDSSRFR